MLPRCGRRVSSGGWGNHRYSSEHGSGRKDAPLHSSPADHKKGQEIFFCCVTTRSDSAPASAPQTVPRRGWPRRDECPWHAGRAVRARLPHALGELPAADAVVADASRPANGVPVSGRSGLGSSVGSSAGPDRSCDTLGAGRSANRGDDHWSNLIDREYAVDVPREGFAPEGAAREIA